MYVEIGVSVGDMITCCPPVLPSVTTTHISTGPSPSETVYTGIVKSSPNRTAVAGLQ